ncbi:hypothetical protein PIB30_036482 [Stylosanthes scabra]|uniref:Uncharacterized protein n=1 Tax=Stylosanthes scabra TaxID=79078 RepID=A0ABU6XC88_9FABA|nr:hypothetical protein [Stylosanthes scabra]
METSALQNLHAVDIHLYGDKPMTTVDWRICKDSSAHSGPPDTSANTGKPSRQSPSSNDHTGLDLPKEDVPLDRRRLSPGTNSDGLSTCLAVYPCQSEYTQQLKAHVLNASSIVMRLPSTNASINGISINT